MTSRARQEKKSKLVSDKEVEEEEEEEEGGEGGNPIARLWKVSA